MPVNSGSNPDTPQRTRTSLSTRTKRRIRELVGRCEYCDALHHPDKLEVHQLSALPKPPYRPDENPQNRIIVLCKEHHTQVCEGKISKFSLKEKIAKRSGKHRKELRSALQKCDRTYAGTNVTKIRDPRQFDIFLQDKNGRRRE